MLVNVFSKKVYADEQKEATSTEGERSGEAEEKKIEEEKHTREGSAGRKLQEVLGQQEAAPGRPTQQDNALETTSVRPSSTPLALSQASFTQDKD